MFTLRAKPWQAFLNAVIALVLINLIVVNSLMITWLCNGLGLLLYFGWFAVLGNELFRLLPPNVHYSITWFLLNVILIVAFMAAIAMLTESRSYLGEGLMALPVFYFFFAILHVPRFLAVSLVAVERRRKPRFIFYFVTLLFILFWPIGVWFVQPRLNKIYTDIQANA